MSSSPRPRSRTALSSRARSFLGLVLVTSAMVSSANPAHAQCSQWIEGPLSPHGLGTDGPVNASLSWDPDGAGPQPTSLIIAGDFASVDGVSANCIAAWDGLVWRPLGSGIDGEVRALAVFNGQLVAGGSFSSAGGATTPRIARWTGSAWLPLGNGVSGYGDVVLALASYGGRLFVGGDFALPYPYIALWDGSNWENTVFFNERVTCFALLNNKLYAGGWFNRIGLTTVENVLEFDGTWWDRLANSGNSPIRPVALAASQGSLYAADANGVHRNTPGAPSWVDVAGGPCDIQTLADVGGMLYAGGYCCPGQGRYLKRIQLLSGSSWFPVGYGIGPECPSTGGDQVVRTICDFGGSLVAGGRFDVIDDITTTHPAINVARWNGSNWFTPSAPVRASAIATYGSKVAIGGYLSQSTPSGQAYHLASWDGVQLSPMGDGPDGPVSALYGYTDGSAPFNVHLVAGGTFNTAGGVAAGRVAMWTEPTQTPGNYWSAMGAGLDNAVLALHPYRGDIVAGGIFIGSGGTSVNRVARWQGSSWQPMGAGMNGTVRTLRAFFVSVGKNDILIAGGDFTTANGAAASRIAYWTESTLSPTTPWQPMGSGLNGSVYAIERHGGATYAAGTFTASGPTALNRIGRWTGSAWVAVGAGTFGGGFNGPVYSLRSEGGYLYAAGDFTSADGVPAYHVARWDGTSWNGPSGGPTGVVNAMAAYHGEVLGGGEFGNVIGADNSLLYSQSLARFLGTGAPWIAQQPASQVTQSGQSATFSITPAPGYSGLLFSWRKDGQPLVDGPTPGGSSISGSGTATLTISSTVLADSGSYECQLLNGCGSTVSVAASLNVTTPVAVEFPGAPGRLMLRVRPNPAMAAAHLDFALPRAGLARVEIFDLQGRSVAVPLSANLEPGIHHAAWTGERSGGGRAAAGIYLVRISSRGADVIRRFAWLP